jgi:hypothetical protein
MTDEATIRSHRTDKRCSLGSLAARQLVVLSRYGKGMQEPMVSGWSARRSPQSGPGRRPVRARKRPSSGQRMGRGQIADARPACVLGVKSTLGRPTARHAQSEAPVRGCATLGLGDGRVVAARLRRA